MSSCKLGRDFRNFYFFQNGVPCEPEKLRVRENEVEKYLSRTEKGFFYQAGLLYTTEGELVKAFEAGKENCAFVLVPVHDQFLCENYEEVFETMMKKRNCKSAPQVPSSTSCESKTQESQNEVRSGRGGQLGCCEPKPRSSQSKPCPDPKPKPCEKESKPKVCPEPKPKPCVKESKPKVCPKPCEKESKPKVCCPKPKAPKPKPSCGEMKSRSSCGDTKSKASCGETKSKASCGDSKSRSSCGVKKSQSSCNDTRPPSSCDEEVGPPHVHCVTKDKYPCCDQDSDDEMPDMLSKKGEASGRSSCFPSPERPLPPKRKSNLFAKCCPCCVKKPKVKAGKGSRPSSRDPRNAKRTQTSPEDFKLAKKCLKAAMAKQKVRQKMYGINKKAHEKADALLSCADMRGGDAEGDLCEDDESKQKREDEYKIARAKYREKRKKLELKINKALENEEKKRKKGFAGCS